MTEHRVREIIGRIEGPVAPRPEFEAELLATLSAELDTEAGGTTTSSGLGFGARLGAVARRFKQPKWGIAPAATALAVIVALVVSSTVGDDRPLGRDQELTAPADPGEGEVPDIGGPVDPSEPGRSQSGEDGSSDGASGLEEAPVEVEPDPGTVGDPPGNPVEPPVAAVPVDVLAFASKPGDYWHIYTMNADGSNRQRLTNAAAHDREPDWSPDGSQIVFMRIASEGDHTGEIFVMNADGSNERFLAYGGEPQWSPDGTQIAYTGRPALANQYGQPASIWVMDADGSNRHKLFSGEGAAADVTWSPVGGLLAFAGIAPDLPADPTSGSPSTNLYTMTERGNLVRRLTNTYYACNSEFSPDGTRLAFITSDGGPFVVWTMNTDGSEKAQLTEGPGTYAFPHWSPDGARIAFGFDPDGEPHWVPVPQTAGPEPAAIWIVRADGAGPRKISSEDDYDADPAFAPRALVTFKETRDHRRNSPAPNDEATRRAPSKSVC